MSEIILKPLKGKKNFNKIFESGKRLSFNKCTAVFLKYNKDDNSSKFRIIFYAVIVSKKFSKKAVVRNRIKRLLRESVKQIMKNQPNYFKNIDSIVFIWKEAPPKPKQIRLSNVMPVINEILSRIEFQLSL